MNQEEIYQTQLNQERAMVKKSRTSKISSKKTKGSKSFFKSPLMRIVGPLGLAFGLEVVTFGIAPGWTAQVVWTYHQEKKIKGSANIAEYLIIGGLTAAVDVVQLLGLTGALAFLSLLLTAPSLLLLAAWRFHKKTTLGF